MPLLMTPASCTRAPVQVPAALLQTQLHADASGKAAGDSSSAWSLVTPHEKPEFKDLDCSLAQPRPLWSSQREIQLMD